MKILAVAICWLSLASTLWGEDPGKEAVARLRAVLLFGTDDELAEVVPEAEVSNRAHVDRLLALKGLEYGTYGLLGSDTQPVWRSYTNWASPMKGGMGG